MRKKKKKEETVGNWKVYGQKKCNWDKIKKFKLKTGRVK
jgi:hypothetical protein